jgi:prephenate dehydrogenase
MTDPILNKLVIIGVGLIGGSFALALRKAGMVKFIVGVGRNKENIQQALNLGVIDEIADNPASAVQNADLVLLAMPVGKTANIMAQIAPHLESKTILTDAGSTKQDVIIAAQSYLADNLKNFVPGHPIAGAEQSGVDAAQANLFYDKHIILTPLAETTHHALNKVIKCWQCCGGKVSQMQAKEHDSVLAATSHLPHILAFTLMNYLRTTSKNDPDNLLRFAGSGFRDFTRIASSSPEMWRDICLANREALLTQIDAYKNVLMSLQKNLESSDGHALEKAFTEAREIRASWLKNST